MSGIEAPGQELTSDRERRIISVLDRHEKLDALEALSAALKPPASKVPLNDTALALDSGVFLRLAAKSTVVDYLESKHAGPLILPGQAIQEFWNNHFRVVDSISDGISKSFDGLTKEVEKVDENFGEFSARFLSLLTEFRSSYGYVFDGATLRRTLTLIDILKNRAEVDFSRRELFTSIAKHRKKTKTPPGFQDSGDGDFFVWVDLLTSLLRLRDQGTDYSRVVLVSNDSKMDWSRSGTAHPILSAEVMALTGVPFEIWTLDKLGREVSVALG